MKTSSTTVFLITIGALFLVSIAVIRISGLASSTSLSVNNVAPSIDSVKLCAGSGDPSGCLHVNPVIVTGGTTTPFSIAGTLHDDNGFSDITTFLGEFYEAEFGINCIADPNNCYTKTLAGSGCTLTSTSSTAGTFECPIAVEYYAIATDDNATVEEGGKPTGYWVVRAVPSDAAGASDATASQTTEINTYRDLSACGAINYGTLANGDASSSGVPCVITNDGNVAIDVEISASALACDNGSIPSGNQRADVNDLSYASMVLSGTSVAYTASAQDYSYLELAKQTAGQVSDTLYSTISVPYAVSGTCGGTNVISATAIN